MSTIYQTKAEALAVKQEILNQVVSGIKGTATQANAPTAYTPETYPDGLIETYRVVEPIDVTSTWYTLADATNKAKFPITQEMLNANDVLLTATNGVVSVFLNTKPVADPAKIATWTATAFASGAQVIHEGKVYQSTSATVAGDVPGVSNKWGLKIFGYLTDEFNIGTNILNPNKMITGKQIYQGAPYDASWAKSFWFLPVKENQVYSTSGTYNIAWYDINKTLISETVSSTEVISPSGAFYLSVDYNFADYPNPVMVEGSVYPVIYEPFEGEIRNYIPNLNIDLVSEDNKKVIIGNANTNEVIVNNVRSYYQNAPAGSMFGGGAGGETIPNIAANTGWGAGALKSVTTGGSNTAFGFSALKSLTTGWDNTAFGSGAMENFVDGIGNQAMGRLALFKLTVGFGNTALADTALELLELGESNTAVGYAAGVGIRQGMRNNLFGLRAGGHYAGSSAPETNKDDTCAFGFYTLSSCINGSRNSVYGNYGMHVLNGEENAGFGHHVFRSTETGNRNTAFGSFAGAGLINGDENIYVGYKTGSNTHSFTGTTLIGYMINPTRSNEVKIGKPTDTHFTICGVEFTKAQLVALKALVS